MASLTILYVAIPFEESLKKKKLMEYFLVDQIH